VNYFEDRVIREPVPNIEEVPSAGL
jgi:hypothetical protein